MSGSLVWIREQDSLPDADTALSDPPGLVAAGYDLSIPRLTQAYRKGIFPWFSPADPVLWWSPDPRMVLLTDELHISKSMRKLLRQIENPERRDQPPVVITTDLAFESVLKGCATRGSDPAKPDTWITSEMQAVYLAWHNTGQVHSVETWVGGQLAAGLYGVCLGRQFFGESMFSTVANASKLAMIYLVAYLRQNGVSMIDCQMQTDHLASLGAKPIARKEFLRHVRNATDAPAFQWCTGRLEQTGNCLPATLQDLNLRLDDHSSGIARDDI